MEETSIYPSGRPQTAMTTSLAKAVIVPTNGPHDAARARAAWDRAKCLQRMEDDTSGQIKPHQQAQLDRMANRRAGDAAPRFPSTVVSEAVQSRIAAAGSIAALRRMASKGRA